MARKLEEYTFVTRGRSLYDWTTLLDGSIYQLTHGEDFECSPESFRGAARQAASRQEKTLHVAVDGENVFIQAVDKVGDPS